MMTATEVREIISSFNGKRFIGMKEYKMGTALGVELALELESVNRRTSLITLLLGCFMCNFRLECSGIGKLLFIYSPNYMHREGHKKDFLTITKIISDSRVIMAYHQSAYFDFTGILNIFWFIVWFVQLRGFTLGLWQKIYVVGLLGMCRKWVYILKHDFIMIKPVLVTTFCDAHMHDNITAQYCRINCIPTATLQHGIYPVSSGDLFAPAYELFVSDVFLAWGEQTKECAIKSGIAPERIYVAGVNKKVKRITMTPDVPIFGVMLSGNVEHAEQINAQLIMLANDLAGKLGFRYIIRTHPSKAYTCEHLYQKDLLDSVCDNSISLLEMANSVRFFICVSTSTTAYELMQIGAIVFIHNNSFQNHFYSDIEKICFKTEEDLCQLVEWADKYKMDYNQEIKKIVQYMLGTDSEHSYRLFFERYLNDAIY